MISANAPDPHQAFAESLRELLPSLYDPGVLRRSPLLDLLSKSHDAKELHDILVHAIAALRPSPEVPAHAVVWRNYYVLTYRFVEQSTQTEVADDLCVSVRQLRRYEQAAVSWLADALWRKYDLAQYAEQLLPLTAGAEEPIADRQPVFQAQDREKELAWLRQSFPRAASSPQDLVHSAARTVGPLADETAVRLTCRVPDDLLPIMGQLGALRQALISLLTAAVHAVPGGVVSLVAQEGEEGLVLVVRAIAPTIQEPTAPSAEVSEGLSMARQLAEAFGATLTMPATVGDSGERLHAQMTLPRAREAQILVVDDNADALCLFERYLQDTRYCMLSLREPERTLDVAAETHPDAILLDVMLPGMDGWELLGRLREHPATRQIPVLVCTILPQEELALALGAAAFIRKPVGREALLAVLARALP